MNNDEIKPPESVFSGFEPAPADGIFGLNARAKADTRDIVNAGIGVYRDDAGKIPVFQAIKKVEATSERSGKGYLPISGLGSFTHAAQELVFIGASDRLETLRSSGRITSLQTPGGTGALSLAQAMLRGWFPGKRVLLSSPTWPAHRQIFENKTPQGDILGFECDSYPYWDTVKRTLAIEDLLSSLDKADPHSIVLLHGCCHNPTGIDPEPEQLEEIARIIKERLLIPVVDLAYQGLGNGLEEDTALVRALVKNNVFTLVAESYSKKMGLYDDRVGALHVIAPEGMKTGEASPADFLMSWIKPLSRRMWSNPPRPGVELVEKILSDSSLFELWKEELAEMRDTIARKRRLFVDQLKERGFDFEFMRHQKGMFSFTSLPSEAAEKLETDHAIYIPRSGRINVAAITTDQMSRVCDAVATVIKELKLDFGIS